MIRIVKSYILSLLLVFFGHRLLSGPAAAESVGARQSARADRTVQAIAVPRLHGRKIDRRNPLAARLGGFQRSTLRIPYRPRHSHRSPQNRQVISAESGAGRLARWIATTCLEVKGSLGFEYTDRLLRWIRGQSGRSSRCGASFTKRWSGPGATNRTCSKDGVTVYVADNARFPADGHCTPEQLAFYLTLTDADLKPRTGRYARICSTTREQYKAAGGRDESGRQRLRPPTGMARYGAQALPAGDEIRPQRTDDRLGQGKPVIIAGKLLFLRD